MIKLPSSSDNLAVKLFIFHKYCLVYIILHYKDRNISINSQINHRNISIIFYRTFDFHNLKRLCTFVVVNGVVVDYKAVAMGKVFPLG